VTGKVIPLFSSTAVPKQLSANQAFGQNKLKIMFIKS